MANSKTVVAKKSLSGDKVDVSLVSSDFSKGMEKVASIPANVSVQLAEENGKTVVVDPSRLDKETVQALEKIPVDQIGQFNSSVLHANSHVYFDTAKDMTGNVSGYRMNLSKLMWPEDIQSDNINIPYTVFYISEHQDASIAKNASSHADKTQYQYPHQHVSIPDSQVTESFESMNPDEQKSTNKAAQTAGQVVSGVGVGLMAAGVVTAIGRAIGQPTLAKVGAKTVGIGTAVATGVNVDASRFGIKTQYVRLNSCIVLPTPTLSSSNSFDWEGDGDLGKSVGSSLFHLGAAAFGSLSNSASKAIQLKGGEAWDELKNSWNHITNTTKNNKANDFAVMAGLKTMNAASGDLAGRLSGLAINPRKEQTFRDVNFREYDFKYTMFARSKQEMEQIMSIIQVFKYHAHPELSPSTFLYTYPAHFDIVHYYQGHINQHLPRHASSVLKSIDVTYGEGDHMAIMEDGAPVTITMTLKFVELAIINRQDIANGY